MQSFADGAETHTQASERSSVIQAFLRRGLKQFFFAFFTFWLLSAGLVLARGKFFLKLSDPTLSFWFDNGNDAHADIAGFNPQTQRFTSKETHAPVVVYPGPMMMVYMALTRWTSSPVFLYGVVIFATALLLALCFGRILTSVLWDARLGYSAALIGVAFFYPLWFVFERSNVEAIVWLPTALGIIALYFRRYKTAAVLVALAASLKIYPGILMLAFLRKNRYQDFALSVLSYAAFSAVGLWWLNPNLLAALQEMNSGMATVTHAHFTLYEGQAIGYDHSFFSIVKQLIRMVYPDIARYHYEIMRSKILTAMKAYVVITPLIFAAVFLAFVRRLPDTNRLVILLIFSVTLPPVSYEYTLIQSLPGYLLLFAYFVQAHSNGVYVPARWLQAVSVSFIIVSLPLAFLGGSTVGYGGQVKLVALMVPVAFCSLHPMNSDFRRELAL